MVRKDRVQGLAIALGLILPIVCGAEVRGVIEVSGDRAIRLAIAPPAGDPSLAVRFDALVTGDLERSHWFERIPLAGPPPADPARVLPSEVPAAASFLVSSEVRDDAGAILLRGYLHSSDGVRQFGREYRLEGGRLALAAHRFADDLVRELTGEAGLAGTVLAFVADHQGKPALHTAAPDGSDLKRIVSGPFECLFPRFAPNHRWLLYTAYPRDFPQLMLFDPVSGRNQIVSARAGLNTLGAMSPDGSQVAAVLSYEGNPEIYLLDLTGRVRRRLTSHRANDLSPTWSPDGSRIAFVSDRAGSPAVYVLEVEGRDPPRRLTHGFDSSDECVNPAWSPRGDLLAFSARGPRGFGVRVHRFADSAFFEVTDGSEGEEALDWAPDNRHLVVASTRQGVARLEVVDARRPSNRYSIPLPALAGVRDPTWCKVSY